MKKLFGKIGYKFKNKRLLETALTHSSYANEHKVPSYERLEFLGDSILSFVVSTYLFDKYPDLPEGEMSKLRAAIVCEKSLCEAVKRIGLCEDILLSKGEIQTGGRERPSIVADVFEAVLGAIYIDGGIKPTKNFVMDKLGETISSSYTGKGVFNDYKTKLQEIVQIGNGIVNYVHVKEEGPEHNKVFTVQVKLAGKIISTGNGRSKKDAEQSAAQAAIAVLLKEDEK